MADLEYDLEDHLDIVRHMVNSVAYDGHTIEALASLEVAARHLSDAVGEVVEALLQDGAKHKDIAAALNVSSSTFSRWIRGAR